MKKIGILVFIFALAIGVILANVFNLGNLGINVGFQKVNASGVTKTEKRDVAGFSSIDASGVVVVNVTSQKDFDVQIEADENLLPYIKTEVDGDTLKIFRKGWMVFSGGGSKPVITVSMPQIDNLDISGASSATMTDLNENNLRIDASGASKITLFGQVTSLSIDSSGACHIDAENLKAVDADIDASGASRISVAALNDLRVDANGASKIVYAVEPKNLEQDVSGASSVRKK